MDKETLARIFEPFFTTKAVGKGTGLGLATVFGIVNQNNGFIRVHSLLNQGTTFKIFLPKHLGQIATTETDAADLPKGNGETVLLVEDEPATLAIAWKFLERLGYTVLTATMPSDAIRLAQAHTSEIHLLLTDVVMPEFNGKDLRNRLVSVLPKLKCLFMSGYTHDVIAPHGVLDQEVCFIQKPFSIDDLAVKVRDVLHKERPKL